MNNKSLMKVFSLFLVVALLAAALPLQAKVAAQDDPTHNVVPASVVYPSTNDINRTNGWAHVDFVSADAVARTMTFKLVQPRAFFSCVEYRTSAETEPYYTNANYNPYVLDGLYRYTCQSTIGEKTITVTLEPSATYVEFRLAFGAESDERFYWTPFTFVPEVWVDDSFTGTEEGLGITKFLTIQEGIDAVAAGGTVNVAAGTYSVTSTINVDVPVTISGAGIEQTIVKTEGTDSDPVNIFNVSVDDVTISNMTIQHKKNSNTSVEAAIVLSKTSWPNYTPVLGFTLDSCRVEYMEFAVSLRGGDWALSNNEFVYTGVIDNSNRIIGVYGTTGLNTVNNNSFIGSDNTSGNTDFIYLTSSGYNETYGGTLQINGNTQTGGNIRHFYIQEVFSGSGLTLFADGNSTAALNGNFVLFGAGTISPFDHFTSITLLNNSVSNVRGKGLLALDGDSGLKNAGSTTITMGGNALTNAAITADGYLEATGSIGGLVGYKSSVFYDPNVTVKQLVTYVLDNNEIDENLPEGMLVGTFSPVDADPGDVFTYALVDNDTNPNNNPFKIVEGQDQLLSNEKFNFEAKSSYEIRVRATDPWGTVFEKPFTIKINDINEEPVLDPIDDETKDEGTTLSFDADAEDEEVEAGEQTLTFSLVGAPDGATINKDSGVFTWLISEEQGPGEYTFSVKVCDDGEPVLCDEEPITVTVNEVNVKPVAAEDYYGVIMNTPRVVAAPGVLANDTDVDLPANTLTAVLQQAPETEKGTLVLNSDGSFTFTPKTGVTGSVTFSYKVFDGKLNSDPKTVTLTIQATSKKPTAIALSPATIAENASIGTTIGTLVTTDEDAGDHFTYTLVPGEGDADNASFYIDGATLKSAEKFNHEVKNSYSVRIRSTDQFGGDNYKEQTFTITVVNVPENPVLAPIGDKVVDEKTLLTFTATAMDEDRPAQTLTFSHVGTLPEGASFTNVPGIGGIFSWTPTELQQGAYTITIKVCDDTAEAQGGPLCDDETFKITVNEVNSAPVANDQSVTVAEDHAGFVITLTGSDADHDPADALTYSIVPNSGPTHGTLTWITTTPPVVRYKPVADYNGPDSFKFKINDGHVDSNIATVSIMVTPVNDAPVSEGEGYNVLKGQTLTVAAPGVLSNDTDADKDTLTAVLTMNVSRGTLTLNSDGSFTYIPGSGEYDSDTFRYKAFDGTAYSLEAEVTLTIRNSNTLPSGLNLQHVTWPENKKYEGTLSATDTPGDVLTYSLVSGSGSFDNDAFEINGTKLVSKSEFNFEAKDSYYVRIRVTDQFGGFSEAPFIIHVTDVNDAPVADDQEVSTLMNTPKEIALTGSDQDGDEMTYAIFSEPKHGTLEATEVLGINFAGNGVLRVVENKLTYTPDDGFAGEDSFTFKVMDESGAFSNLATVTIDVGDIPVAVDDAYEATEDEELSVDAEEGVLANDTAVDPTKLVAELVDDVEHGTLELAPDGSFTYLPEENFVGEDVFTYNACVEGGECSEEPATVTITVEPVNDEPNAVDDAYDAWMGQALEVPAELGVLANDIDPDPSDVQTVEVKDAPLHGVLELNPDGSFTYEPAAGFYGIDTFTYWLKSEPGVQSAYLDSATVTITVRPFARLFLPIILK